MIKKSIFDKNVQIISNFVLHSTKQENLKTQTQSNFSVTVLSLAKAEC